MLIRQREKFSRQKPFSSMFSRHPNPLELKAFRTSDAKTELPRT
jgi:hypothetical protein